MAKNAIVTKETLAKEQAEILNDLPDNASIKDVVTVVNKLLAWLRSDSKNSNKHN